MSVMFIVLDPRFGDWYYRILDWRLGNALSQIEDEVHFDSEICRLVLLDPRLETGCIAVSQIGDE
eukprot:4495115-Heterocapsa_arctica.AAC.1